jgi:phage terminase large subunit
MNSLEDSSLEECKRAIESDDRLKAYYDVGEKYIKSRDGRIAFNFVGLDRNIDSIKSKGRILIFWIDEAEPVTEEAFKTIEPTLREEGENWSAELWLTWNPKRKNAAVERFRNANDLMVKVVQMNYKDNPKFPEKLERQRLRDLETKPDQYAHIWDGDFVTALSGAYFAHGLARAREQGRICNLSPDPLMTIRLFFDIGGTGARADACSIWATQFIGKEIRVINYYEAVGQPLATHVTWLREQGYTPEVAQIWLPHDGKSNDKVFNVSYESALREVGYSVTVVPNQGAGAAKLRIEAVRRILPSVWFDETKTQAGREALGWYHEKRDEIRNIGLGPNHDWASHGADSFGLMAIAYEEPVAKKPKKERRQFNWKAGV